MNTSSIIILIVLVIVAALALRSIIKDHKQGKCLGSCSACKLAGTKCPHHNK